LTNNYSIIVPGQDVLSCDNLNIVEWKIVYCKFDSYTVLLDESSNGNSTSL